MCAKGVILSKGYKSLFKIVLFEELTKAGSISLSHLKQTIILLGEGWEGITKENAGGWPDVLGKTLLELS